MFAGIVQWNKMCEKWRIVQDGKDNGQNRSIGKGQGIYLSRL